MAESWKKLLAEEFERSYFRKLYRFVRSERKRYTVYPPERETFAALDLTPCNKVRVVLLGQDPYHDDGQAHGLCFSVRPGTAPPPSLQNMFKELQRDLGIRAPNHGCLERWARQGVLLLNTVLTVRAHRPASHRNRGWENFTDEIFRAVNRKRSPVIFLLWGNDAKHKKQLIDTKRHFILEAAHPSPLSAARGFFGSRPFSKTNIILSKLGKPEIDWQLPDF